MVCALCRRLELDLEDVLETLPARESQVLRLRYGLSDGVPKTLRQVAQLIMKSQETVRKDEQRALQKLRSTGRIFTVLELLEIAGMEGSDAVRMA